MTKQPTPIGMHEDGSFRFHVPIDLKKGEDGKTWIEGVASVEVPDIQGDTVILAGMDLSYLLNRGYFNDNHAKSTDGKVGVPTEARATPEGLKVRGYLFDTPRAKGILDLADALKKSGSDRRLGFSVEGKTIKRDGKIVKRSWIKDIAITAEPVNPYTYMDVIKSISEDIEQNGYVEDDKDDAPETESLTFFSRIEQAFTSALRKVFPEKSDAPDLEKMMEAGTQNPPESGGSALRKESIDKELINLDMPQPADEDRQITMEEAIEKMVERGYPPETSRRIVERLFTPANKAFIVTSRTQGGTIQ